MRGCEADYWFSIVRGTVRIGHESLGPIAVRFAGIPAAKLPDLMPKATVYILAWFAVLVAAVAFAARFVPVINHSILIVAALSPYLVIATGAFALLLLLAQRSWWAVGPALLCAAALAVQVPLYFSSGRIPPDSVAIRVLTANLHDGAADAEVLVSAARRDADLVVVQELTPELAASFGRLGLDSDFPYRAVESRRGSAGVGLWSRYPITGSSRDPRYELGLLTASIQVPGASSETVVLSVHLVGPWPQPIDGWRGEVSRLPDNLRAAAKLAGAGAVIVAGDFNATTDMQPFRRLLRGGFTDAVDQSGAGFTPTFAANRSIPPLIGIDHILTLNSTASELRTVRIPGTDHLGLTAVISVPK